MLKLENKILDTFDIDLYQQEGFEITSCIINKVNVAGCKFTQPVKISNCIITSFLAVGTWFEEGITIENSTFLQETTFEAGGYNKPGAQVVLKNNIFHPFVNFFDCHYSGPFIFKNNLILNGSNLLGNTDTPIGIRFEKGNEISNNNGILNSDNIDFL